MLLSGPSQQQDMRWPVSPMLTLSTIWYSIPQETDAGKEMVGLGRLVGTFWPGGV